MSAVPSVEAQIVPGRYVAIDIGTVTCRMLVADAAADGLEMLAKEYRITNLGEGVDATRELLPAAMQRVDEAVRGFLRVRSAFDEPDHPILGTMAVATSAARDARNASEFEAMLARAGVELSVISGAQEAALTFAGATASFPAAHVMVVDVGGGSTEISIGQAGGAIDASRSFDIGCRRVTERFLQSDPPTAEELRAAREWMDGAFADWFAEVSAQGCQPADTMVAVAGTATTAVSIRERMATYDSARVNGARVTADQVRGIGDMLTDMTLAERRNVVGLDPGRAPVITAGMLILQSIMVCAHVDAFTVSESDILDGMILRLADRSQQEREHVT